MNKEQSIPGLETAYINTDNKVPAILAIVFGAFIVLGVGFSHSHTIHNAAHDARHAFAFPCH